jgi:arginase
VNRADPTGTSHLRLIWPQWQGAGTESIRSLAPEFPFDVARRGYSVGTKVLLQAVLPEHDGPSAVVPVEMGDEGSMSVTASRPRPWCSPSCAQR